MGELPNKHVVDHPDAYLNVLLDYTGGFYGAAREAGLPAKTCADAMQHVESAARGLHRKANEAASRISELEAKLATAVGALERITKVQFAASARAIARNTLASIKGES